jgi:hypothetical protein
MKARANYVSNSSSSSFIVFKWAEAPEEKRRMVLEYQKYAVEEWRKHGIRTVVENGNIHPDYLSVGEEPTGDGRIGYDSEYNFGWVQQSPCWRFREDKELDILEMVTSMDNFNMEAWMNHIGGLKYRYTGESFGFFNDEPVQFGESKSEEE